jgi:hypothetical protein
MERKQDPKAGGTLFHPVYGESRFMFDVDRRHALHFHGDHQFCPTDTGGRPLPGCQPLPEGQREWKPCPWTDEEIEVWKKRDAPVVSEVLRENAVTEPKVKRRVGRPFTKKVVPQTVATE